MLNNHGISKEQAYLFRQECMSFALLNKHYFVTITGELTTVCITDIEDDTKLYLTPVDAIPFEITDSEGTRYNREELHKWIRTMFGILSRQEDLRREFITAKMGVDRCG